MGLEIDGARPEGFEFLDVYYGEANGDTPYSETAKSHTGVVAMLGDLKQKLQAAYPDCAPLRNQLHRIDVSISMIGKMKLADS